MLLNVIKHVVKRILHDASDEWAEEFGVPNRVIQELRSQRQQHEAERLEQLDAMAVQALNVEDDEEQLALPGPETNILPEPTSEAEDYKTQQVPPESSESTSSPQTMPSAARVTRETTSQPTNDMKKDRTPSNHVATDEGKPQSSANIDELMTRVHKLREHGAAWSTIAEEVNQKGEQLTEEALRSRYRRWKEKTNR